MIRLGQEEVLKAIEELGFTSLEELREILDITDISIGRSLSTLNKYGEVQTTTLGRRTIYFSNTFFEDFEILENE